MSDLYKESSQYIVVTESKYRKATFAQIAEINNLSIKTQKPLLFVDNIATFINPRAIVNDIIKGTVDNIKVRIEMGFDEEAAKTVSTMMDRFIDSMNQLKSFIPQTATTGTTNYNFQPIPNGQSLATMAITIRNDTVYYNGYTMKVSVVKRVWDFAYNIWEHSEDSRYMNLPGSGREVHVRDTEVKIDCTKFPRWVVEQVAKEFGLVQ